MLCKDYARKAMGTIGAMKVPSITSDAYLPGSFGLTHGQENVSYEVKAVGDDTNTVLASGVVDLGGTFTVSPMPETVPFADQLQISLYRAGDEGEALFEFQSVIMPSTCNESDPVILPYQLGGIQIVSMTTEDGIVNLDGRKDYINEAFGDSKRAPKYTFPVTISSPERLNLTGLYASTGTDGGNYFYDVPGNIFAKNPKAQGNTFDLSDFVTRLKVRSGSKWAYDFGPIEVNSHNTSWVDLTVLRAIATNENGDECSAYNSTTLRVP